MELCKGVFLKTKLPCFKKVKIGEYCGFHKSQDPKYVHVIKPKPRHKLEPKTPLDYLDIEFVSDSFNTISNLNVDQKIKDDFFKFYMLLHNLEKSHLKLGKIAVYKKAHVCRTGFLGKINLLLKMNTLNIEIMRLLNRYPFKDIRDYVEDKEFYDYFIVKYIY